MYFLILSALNKQRIIFPDSDYFDSILVLLTSYFICPCICKFNYSNTYETYYLWPIIWLLNAEKIFNSFDVH